MIISKNIFDYCEKNKFNLKQACESDIDEILQLYIDRTLWFKQNKSINGKSIWNITTKMNF